MRFILRGTYKLIPKAQEGSSSSPNAQGIYPRRSTLWIPGRSRGVHTRGKYHNEVPRFPRGGMNFSIHPGRHPQKYTKSTSALTTLPPQTKVDLVRKGRRAAHYYLGNACSNPAFKVSWVAYGGLFCTTISSLPSITSLRLASHPRHDNRDPDNKFYTQLPCQNLLNPLNLV